MKKRIFIGLYAVSYILLSLAVLVSLSSAQSLNMAFSGKETKHPKLESILERLQEEYEKSPMAAQEFSQERDIRIKDEKVTVFLFSETGRPDAIDKNALQAHGAEIVKQGDSIMKVKVPINRLKQIADNVKGISFIKLPDKPMPLAYQSEGVSLTGASFYQSAGYTGSGVKVAVIDLGFAELSSAISAGELPSSVVKVDCTGSSCVSTTFPSETEKHGTAVAEVVYDMAPGAQLYLIKVADRLDLRDAKNYCVSNGIKIINHSVGWVNTNFYSGECYNDNPVCTANDACRECSTKTLSSHLYRP